LQHENTILSITIYFLSQNIIETLRSLPDYQKLLQELRDKGVDVDKFIDLFRALFGLSRRGKFCCIYKQEI